MNPLAYNFYLFLEKITAKITKKIITVSQADFDIGIKKRVAGQDKISLIHYAIEQDQLNDVFRERREKDNFIQLLPFTKKLTKRRIYSLLSTDSEKLYHKLDDYHQIFIPVQI